MAIDIIAPMLAVPGKLPSSAVEKRYAYEMKWDGVRIITYLDGSSVTALSRNLIDVTNRYPELSELVGHRCVLDGEIVGFDDTGKISFGALQDRMHVNPGNGIPAVPIAYLVFDVLAIDSTRTLSLPYEKRRELLFDLSPTSAHVHLPEHFVGTAADAFVTSEQLGVEGIIAKRLGSPYIPGTRSRDWIKIKHTQTQEVVIGGWRPGGGQRSGMIGSLLMGVPSDEGLRYIGHVGTGFTATTLRDLMAQLKPLETRTSPFSAPLDWKDARDAHWVQPKLVGEVEYSQWTRDGVLRTPSWRGLRPDKEPGDVQREDL